MASQSGNPGSGPSTLSSAADETADSNQESMHGSLSHEVPLMPVTAPGICFKQQSIGQRGRVSLFVMLDSSGSMEESTRDEGTKWEAFQAGLRAFVSAPPSDQVSLGLQFFPLLKPGTNSNCTSQADCGADGGPCYLSTCLQGEIITLCRSAADCPGSALDNPCVEFGICSESEPDNGVACLLNSGACGADAEGNSLGTCVEFERVCTNATQCAPVAYAQPAIELGPLDAAQGLLIDAVLSARPLRGLTLSAPALTGAIEYSRSWSVEHPNDRVATVLITDGSPTECETDFDSIPDIAAAGLSNKTSIRTFVIGLLSSSENRAIVTLNRTAQSGGTVSAMTLDPSEQLSRQIEQSLNTVAQRVLNCSLHVQLPGSADLSMLQVRWLSDDGEPFSSSESTAPPTGETTANLGLALAQGISRVAGVADCSANTQS